MPGHRPNDSTKKSRWSAAQKAEKAAQKTQKAQARGLKQSRARRDAPEGGARRPGERTDRPQRRDDARSFDGPRGGHTERGERGGYGRDERRTYDRGARPDRSRSYGRDDARPFERGERTYGDRPQGRSSGRDDRRTFGRDERDQRGDRPQGRSYGNDRRSYGDDRGERAYGRDDRRSYERGDRFDRGGQRGDRSYGDRPQGRSYGRDDRGDRPQGRSYDRPDRGFDRDQRGERPQQRAYGRDERRSFGRDDRGDRPQGRAYGRDDRHDRGGHDRPHRSDERRSFDRDRPQGRGRDDRGERGFDRGARRFDRDDRDARGTGRSYDRDERSFDRRDDRPDRRPEHRVRSFENTPTTTVSAAHERPARTAVPVTEDNGFAKLGVPAELVARLARDGIAEPFPIQEATLPDALAGRDVLGRGRTGSGKTLAFGLAMLARLAGGTPQPNRPRAVVLVPTRELAMQVSDALQPLVHVLGLRHKLVAGGMPYPPQFEALERGVDVLIATPGRLNDLVDRGAAKLDAVEIVVLDEADHMADMGFLPEVTALLDQMPAGGQRLLFSATLDNGIDELVERYLVDPVTHSTDDATASVTTMAHHILLIEPQHKKVITAEVANREGRTVVFVRTKLGADRVALQLREQGVFAAALHGGLNQGQRNRVLNAFREGTLPVLVATDVAARGIHVDDVSVVLQVDPPADHKDYLHRAGRTARAGEDGTVVTLALPHQKKMMERIAREAGVDVEPVRVRVGDDTILAATGARRTSGEPIPEERLRRLLEPPQRRQFGGKRRFGGHGGHGGGGRPRQGGRPRY